MKKIIKVENLSKEYRIYKKQAGLWQSFINFFNRKYFTKKAVDNVSFDIKEGEFVGFLGPNGAGKTTTLKMLSGILVPTSGQVKVMDKIPSDRQKEFLKNLGIVMGQKSQLFWEIPPMDSYLLFKEIYEISDKIFNQRIKKLSKILQMDSVINVPLRKLSLGQRMKAELIAAILHNPKILFLDEPTIGLDVVSKKNMWDFLREYNKKEKTTIILTSHYMEDIKRLCERVIIIDQGKLIYDGTLNKLTGEYIKHKTITIELEKEIDIKTIEKYGKVTDQKANQYEISIPKEQVASVSEKLLKELSIADISINPPEADDVIREIFTKGIK